MNKYRSICLILLIVSVLLGCKKVTKQTKTNSIPENTEAIDISGDYVSEDYSKRDEGYDWVSVSVTKGENDEVNIYVRSRADKKSLTISTENQ